MAGAMKSILSDVQFLDQIGRQSVLPCVFRYGGMESRIKNSNLRQGGIARLTRFNEVDGDRIVDRCQIPDLLQAVKDIFCNHSGVFKQPAAIFPDVMENRPPPIPDGNGQSMDQTGQWPRHW
jgi:hypothetical protein